MSICQKCSSNNWIGWLIKMKYDNRFCNFKKREKYHDEIKFAQTFMLYNYSKQFWQYRKFLNFDISSYNTYLLKCFVIQVIYPLHPCVEIVNWWIHSLISFRHLWCAWNSIKRGLQFIRIPKRQIILIFNIWKLLQKRK